MRWFMLAIFLLLAAGCATADSATKGAPIGLSIEEAREITASFEAKQAEATGSDPLRTPKSMDDVLEILKRDQIDLFGPGIEFASKQTGVQALTLRAQIELAWGEAQNILAETLSGASKHLRTGLHELEAKHAAGETSEQEVAKLEELRKLIGQTTATSDALAKLASEHVAAGAKLTREVIDKNPNDYQGYRVAADYYRLRQDWARFDEMVKKIEETNPTSNGLNFLKGVMAAQRSDDTSKATDYLRKALEKDSKFTRAQVQLFLLQNSISDVYAEYKKLKELNPNHQIVIWAGSYVQKAYDNMLSRRQQVQNINRGGGKNQ